MNLYDKIAEVCAMPHGWCTQEKAITLASLVMGTRLDLIVEIGVWSGKSLLPMALACQELGRGQVIGIDPYAPAASAEGQNAENAAWWQNVADHEAMHKFFMDQVSRWDLQQVVTLLRYRSDDVEPPANIGILHVDGNHGPQALKDVQRFAPSVRDGGFIVLDDLHWDGGEVTKSVDALLAAGCAELFRVVKSSPKENDDWAVFQKLSHKTKVCHNCGGSGEVTFYGTTDWKGRPNRQQCSICRGTGKVAA